MPSTTSTSNSSTTAPPPYTPSDQLSMKTTAKPKNRFSFSTRRISSDSVSTTQTDTPPLNEKDSTKTKKKAKSHVNKEPFYAAAAFHAATR